MLLSEGGITIAVLSWSLLILPFYAYIYWIYVRFLAFILFVFLTVASFSRRLF
jgi:hypothetical protein